MTDISLREYIERILDERKNALELQLDNSRREVDHAANALADRLESMNEFRRQIDSERALYVQRPTLEKIERDLDARLKTIENSGANMVGRLWALGVGISAFWGLVVLVIGLVVKFWN